MVDNYHKVRSPSYTFQQNKTIELETIAFLIPEVQDVVASLGDPIELDQDESAAQSTSDSATDPYNSVRSSFNSISCSISNLDLGISIIDYRTTPMPEEEP